MNERHDRITYPPLNTLKPVAEDIWMVDGPMIRFGMAGFKMPFSTRMTIIRLRDGGLFIHSPTELTDALRAEVAGLGRVRHIVAPNRIHYWWIPEWHDAFPAADVWLAPKVREQAGDRIGFGAANLDGDCGYPWDGEIRTLPITSRFMTEVEFFHEASGSLILTDLIENFEARKLSWPWRWLALIGGVVHPDGGMPRDMRLSFSGRRPHLRAAVERMMAWQPRRIILAHGRCPEGDGARELRRAFRWLLDDPRALHPEG